MIITEYGAQKVVCDECDINEHMVAGDFAAEITVMKDHGWKITRPEGQWRHECPSCVHDASPLTKARKKFGLA